MYDVEIFVKQTDDAKDFELPKYESEQAAGLDLRANVTETVIIKPGQRAAIGTGLMVEIPVGYEIQVRPRSGLAINKGITVLNTPGTVDSDFRGEIKVIIINHGEQTFLIKRGDKIAQMVVNKFERAKLTLKGELSETERGEKGFGSTGV